MILLHQHLLELENLDLQEFLQLMLRHHQHHLLDHYHLDFLEGDLLEEYYLYLLLELNLFRHHLIHHYQLDLLLG